MDYSSRLTTLQRSLTTHQLSGLVITKRANLAYLTGSYQMHPYNREAILLVSPQATIYYHSPFLTPPKFAWLKTQAMSKTWPVEKVYRHFFSTPASYTPGVKVAHTPGVKIGIESFDMTVAEQNRLQTALPNAKLIDNPITIESYRLFKDNDELKLMRHAGLLTAKLMSWAIKILTSPEAAEGFLGGDNQTELSLSHLLESQAYSLGADSLSFPPVVAFGPHTALPHHQATKRRLKPNDVVLIDLGCTYKGYTSDMTRTFYLGTPLRQYNTVASAVLSAYQAGLKLLSQSYKVDVLTTSKLLPRSDQKSAISPGVKAVHTPGVSAANLDTAVRSAIEKAGFGKQFIHTSGHGLGLEIHEQPSLNSNNQCELRPGMVITLEPGIYLPGHFGYRHENTLSVMSRTSHLW